MKEYGLWSLGWICRRGAGDKQVYGFRGGAMEASIGQSLHDGEVGKGYGMGRCDVL